MSSAERPSIPGAEVSSFAAGRYRVQRVLGSGGQKVVYLVRDAALERDCALSLLHTDALGAREIERLRREARALAQVGAHPNVVTVFDLDEEQGTPFLVCEYVPGGDLAAAIDHACGPLPLQDAVRVARDLLRGLAFVHRRGIVHRDLKPANVWLDADGSAKLGDFGLALAADASRMTEAGTVLGTPTYIAPEQLRGPAIDGRADLYALGCVLYEMLTGRPPFAGDPLAVISQHLHATPSGPGAHNPEVSGELDRYVLRLLAKTPAQRPPSADDALAELERALSTSTRASDEAPTLSRLARLPFVGRASEFEALSAALDEALSGRGALRVIAGEPGIGKTRLAHEVALRARQRGARAHGSLHRSGGPDALSSLRRGARSGLSRRHHRAPARPAGQDAAGAGDPHGDPGGRQRADRVRRAHRRGHPPRPAPRGRGREVPRRPHVSPARGAALSAAAARKAGRRDLAGRHLPRRAEPTGRTTHRARRAGRARCSNATTGRATCASCATCWSTPPWWEKAPRSSRPIFLRSLPSPR